MTVYGAVLLSSIFNDKMESGNHNSERNEGVYTIQI